MLHASCVYHQNSCGNEAWICKRIYKQLFMDGTNRRQTPIQNAIVRYLGENGYETVSVDTAIIAEDETAECLSGCIEHTFNKCGDLLESWRSVAERMYPNRPDILVGIPTCDDVTTAVVLRVSIGDC